MLVERYEKTPKGSRLGGPLGPMRIKKPAPGEVSTHVRLPPFNCVITAWGGKDGEDSAFSAAIQYPDGVVGDEKTAMDSIPIHWEGDRFRSIIQTLFLEFDMRGEGIIQIRWLVDGIPLTEVPLPLEWA